jgi:hypothetical protein
MGKYRVLGALLDRVFRNDLNANFNDVDSDINTQKKRVDDLIKGTPQPSEVVDSRGGFPVLRDRLDDVTTNLAQSTANPKKLKQPLCFNTFWRNGYTLSLEKTEVDQLVELGFDGIVVTLHLEYANSVLAPVEVISDIKAAMTYAVEKGLNITCIKVHCTTTATTGETFKTDYQNALNNILTDFEGLSDNFIILNERNNITDDHNNNTWVLGLINSVKSAGFKCGISLSDLQYYGISDTVLSALDFIGLNCYPRCGFKGKETTLQDCINAIEISPYKTMLLDLKRRFFNKPVYISEFGIRDYYVYYSAPMEWSYDNVNDKADGQTVLNYFGALFDTMNGKVDGIWSWYGVYFPSTIDFFKSWTGGTK